MHRSHHPVALNGVPSTSLPAAAGNFHGVGEPGSPKLHAAPRHMSFVDSVRATSRRLRSFAVPLPVLLICASLAFLTGNWMHTLDTLPAPVGPQITSAAPSTSRRSLLMDGSSSRPKDLQSLQSLITNPLRSEEFERFSLSASGFDMVRPALAPSDSGDSAMRVVPFQTISWYPRITYYPGFVDRERCEHIMTLAKKHMTPSSLAYRPGESVPETQDVRTSSGTFLSREMDRDAGVLAWLEERIASVTHLPVEHGEAFNLLRYMPTQHYDSHYDSFSPDQYGPQPTQRIATFLLFLSDVEEGGETVFKREGRTHGNRTIGDWRGCDDGVGVKVKPRQGDAVLFWSARPDLTLDDHALHGACPVKKGEKWSMAKWIHEKPLRAPIH